MTPQLPIGSRIVSFCGLYLASYKVTPKKELLWSLREERFLGGVEVSGTAPAVAGAKAQFGWRIACRGGAGAGAGDASPT